MKKSVLVKSAFLLAVMLVPFWGRISAQSWQQVDIADLTASDVFVIVDLYSGCAMSNDNGTGNPPAATPVTLNAGQSEITGEVAENLKWNISGNATDGYTFYPNGSTTTWLYCYANNNGVRVGTNANKVFTVHETNWLKNTALNRYVGVYNSQDWRCYTSINSNIQNTQMRYFKYTETASEVETPVITPTGGAYYAPQTVTITCATDGAVIHYTLDGTTPDGNSAVYSVPLTITATTTVKAVAILGDATSNTATATYTLPVQVADIATLRAQATGSTRYRLSGEAVVSLTGSYRNHKYIQDATGAILIDDAGGVITSDYSAGDGMTGLVGTLTTFNGMLEFVPVTDPGEATSHGNVLTPVDLDFDADFEAYEAQLVRISNVTVANAEGTFAANTDYAIAGHDNVNIRLRYAEGALVGADIPTAPQIVTAVVYHYNPQSSNVYNLVPIAMEPYITDCENVPAMGACSAVLDDRDMLFTGRIAADDPACTLQEYGFVYSTTSTEPVIGGEGCTRVEVGTAIAAGEAFSYRLASLGYDTYYVRAYATNEVGTGYSNTVSILQAAPEIYTVNFLVNGYSDWTTVSSLSVLEGEPIVKFPEVEDCGNLVFVGWALQPFEGQAEETPVMFTEFTPVSDTVFYAVFANVSNVVNDEIVISRASFAETVSSYGTDDQWTAVSKVAGSEITGWCDLHTNNAVMQMRVNTPYESYPYNETALPGAISSITMYSASGATRQWTPWLSSTPISKANHEEGIRLGTMDLGSTDHVSWEVGAELNAHYFYIALSGGAAYIDSIVVAYTSADYLYTMLTVDTVVINQSICEGMMYEENNFSAGEEGTYFHLQANNEHCATYYVLNLSVNLRDTIHHYVDTCDRFVLGNEEYTHSAEVDSITPAEETYGCPVVDEWHIVIRHSSESSFDIDTCNFYTWNDTTYRESGVYTKIFANAEDCDSTVTLHLTIHVSDTTRLNDAICYGDTYQENGFVENEEGVYTQYLTNQFGCDSIVILNLTVNPVAEESLETAICASELPYRYVNGAIDTTFDVGTPNLSIFSFHFSTSHGCDSTVTLTLTVNRGDYAEVTVDTCATEFYWEVGGIMCDHSDTYYSYSENANGCEDTVVLILSMHQSVITEINAQICEGETYSQNGFNVSEGGDHQLDLQTIDGCDSTVILHLTVGSEAITNISAGICFGESYTENGFEILNPAVGTMEYQNVVARPGTCDSVVVLALTVNMPTEGDTTATACGSFSWHGYTNLTESGDYTDVLTNAAGCDSTVTLHLTINVPTEGDTTVTACGSFSWHGYENLTESGDYTDVLTNAAGCDSIVTLHLTINVPTESDTTATACGSFSWHGYTNLTESGDYTDVLTNAAGCDSTVTLHLTINVPIESDTTATACGSFNWHGYTNLTESGDYTDVLTNAAGCDSTVTLHLTINVPTEGDTTATACGSYSWHGYENLTESGDYTDVLTNAAGCDSTVTLHLTINVPTEGDTTATACGSYSWHGYTNLTESGDYTDVLTNVAGCDSTVTLHLTINVPSYVEISDTVCSSYSWNDSIYTESGDYVQTFTSSNGCDSVVTLHLTVIIINTEVEYVTTPELDVATLSVVQENAEYQWIDCTTNEPIEGETQHWFNPTVSGSYACVITVGECTDTTECQEVTITGIAEHGTTNITLYPNPTTGIVSICLTPETCTLKPEIHLFDIYGRRLQIVSVTAKTIQIDLSRYATGIYIVKLVNGGKVVATGKVVKE